jgi:hypothetical protein
MRVRRASVRVRVVGLLPALFVAGLSVAAPFAGTTGSVPTAQVTANTSTGAHPPTTIAASTAEQGPALPLHFSHEAIVYLMRFYVGLVVFAVLLVVLGIVWLSGRDRRADRRETKAALVWTDAFTAPRVRSVRSPLRAPRVSPRHSLPVASTPRG